MLYIIVGILVLLYVPFSLKGRVKMIMKTNEVFSKPLHFEIDEKNINVSQGEEMAQLPWEQVYRFVAMIRGYLYSATGRMHTFSQRSSWATAMSR